MKKSTLMIAAAMMLTAGTTKAAVAWFPPEFDAEQWEYIGVGNVEPGIFDYFSNEFPETLNADVYVSKTVPGDYWVEPDGTMINSEENMPAPGAFIVHAADPNKVWTDPIWTMHPLLFCFYQMVPEVMGMQGSAVNYAHMDVDGYISFPARCYQLMTMPGDTPASNLGGNFAVIIPDPAGIEGVNADNDVEAAYFTLQGVKVKNPRTGEIYIETRGKSAKKVIF